MLLVSILLVLLGGSDATAQGNDIFTIVPTSQYVWINTIATFECATNVSGYSLSFSVHVPSYTHRKHVYADGGEKITASFMVPPEQNGTSVRCVADGIIFLHFSKVVYAHAYAQLSPASNLAIQVPEDRCSISIDWDPPHLLPGLSVLYNIYIDGEIVQHNVSTTNYTYYSAILYNNTKYVSTVEIMPYGGPIMGERVNTTLNKTVITNPLNNVTLTYMREFTVRRRSTWHIFLKLSPQVCGIQPTSVSITVCNSVGSSCSTASATSINSERNIAHSLYNASIVSVDFDLKPNQLYTVHANATYAQGSISTDTIDLSVSEIVNVTIINNTDNTICVGFELVRGHTIEEGCIYLAGNMYNETRPIEFDHMENFKEECLENIAPLTLLVTVCATCSEYQCIQPIALFHEVNVTGTSINVSSDMAQPQYIIIAVVVVAIILFSIAIVVILVTVIIIGNCMFNGRLKKFGSSLLWRISFHSENHTESTKSHDSAIATTKQYSV